MTISTQSQDWCKPLGINYTAFARGVAPHLSISDAASLARCNKAWNAFIKDLISNFPSLPFQWTHNTSIEWKKKTGGDDLSWDYTFRDQFFTQLFRSYLYPSIGDSTFFRALTPVLFPREENLRTLKVDEAVRNTSRELWENSYRARWARSFGFFPLCYPMRMACMTNNRELIEMLQTNPDFFPSNESIDHDTRLLESSNHWNAALTLINQYGIQSINTKTTIFRRLFDSGFNHFMIPSIAFFCCTSVVMTSLKIAYIVINLHLYDPAELPNLELELIDKIGITTKEAMLISGMIIFLILTIIGVNIQICKKRLTDNIDTCRHYKLNTQDTLKYCLIPRAEDLIARPIVAAKLTNELARRLLERPISTISAFMQRGVGLLASLIPVPDFTIDIGELS